MKQSYRIFLVLFLLAMTSSCRRNLDTLSLSEAESRLIGSWTFSMVENKVRKDGKWGRNDVSSNYENWKIGFSVDKTLTLEIPNEGKTYPGTWELYETWETDNDGDRDLVTELYLYIYDSTTFAPVREMIWEDMSISNSRFRAQEDVVLEGQKATYFYELVR